MYCWPRLPERFIHRLVCICSSLVLSFAGSGKCYLSNLACNSTGPTRCESFRGNMDALNCFTFYIFSLFSGNRTLTVYVNAILNFCLHFFVFQRKLNLNCKWDIKLLCTCCFFDEEYSLFIIFHLPAFHCKRRNQFVRFSVIWKAWNSFYYILCVDIIVIKPWLKMIPVKRYDIISLQWNDIISLHGLNCPIK